MRDEAFDARVELRLASDKGQHSAQRVVSLCVDNRVGLLQPKEHRLGVYDDPVYLYGCDPGSY